MQYIPNRFDDYFLSKGIMVRYNSLGFTKETCNSFIKETFNIFKESGQSVSNYCKKPLYENYYPITDRIKLTGFENIRKLDSSFRHQNYHNYQMADDWDYPLETYAVNQLDNERYLDNLKNDLRTLENPMVFFSGGNDSEFLLNAFIEAKIPFRLVIFELKDKLGNIINQSDLDYALEYCRKNCLDPIIKDICPETLWQTDFFLGLAKELKLNSPQLTTHAYMIYMMNDLYPGHTHCFAGEIRYQKNMADPENKSVLLGSAKTSNLGMSATNYAGIIWCSTWAIYNNGAGVDNKLYFNNIGQWSVSAGGNNYFYRDGSSMGTPGAVNATSMAGYYEDSGTWTTTPANSYVHRFTITSLVAQGNQSFSYTYQFPSGNFAWPTLGQNTFIVSSLITRTGSSQSIAKYQFAWQCSSVSPNTGTITKTFTLQAKGGASGSAIQPS